MYIEGRNRNRHKNKKLRIGRGVAGKAAIIGARDRETGHVQAQFAPFITKDELHGFVTKTTDVGSTIWLHTPVCPTGHTGRSSIASVSTCASKRISTGLRASGR